MAGIRSYKQVLGMSIYYLENNKIVVVGRSVYLLPSMLRVTDILRVVNRVVKGFENGV